VVAEEFTFANVRGGEWDRALRGRAKTGTARIIVGRDPRFLEKNL